MSATMAALSNSSVDPFKNSSKYNVQLGSSLQANSPDDKTRAIFAFNHKPHQTALKRKVVLSQNSPDNNDCELCIEDEHTDGEQVYKYAGRRLTDAASYLLTFNKDSQSFTLEPAAREYTLNLTSTPQEKDARKLRREYGEVPTGQSHPDQQQESDVENELMDEETEEPDPNNPFDYRHYLNETKQSAGYDSPTLPGTPYSRPLTPQDASKTATKEPTNSAKPFTTPASISSQRASASTTVKQAQPTVTVVVPSVKRNVTRKPNKRNPAKVEEDEIIIDTSAAARNNRTNDNDDNGGDKHSESFSGLTIEVDPETQAKKRKRRNLLGTPSGGGPISLHSVTRSPAPTFTASPPSVDQYKDGRKSNNGNDGAYEDGNAGGDERKRNGDTDVDQFELPSPAVAGRIRARRESTWDADDAADFEAELEQAFEESGVEDGEDAEDEHENSRLNHYTPMEIDSKGSNGGGSAIAPLTSRVPPSGGAARVSGGQESEEESEEE